MANERRGNQIQSFDHVREQSSWLRVPIKTNIKTAAGTIQYWSVWDTCWTWGGPPKSPDWGVGDASSAINGRYTHTRVRYRKPFLFFQRFLSPSLSKRLIIAAALQRKQTQKIPFVRGDALHEGRTNRIARRVSHVIRTSPWFELPPSVTTPIIGNTFEHGSTRQTNVKVN